MAYLPKALVEKQIKVRVRKDRYGKDHTDYEAYFGSDPFTGRAFRITRADKGVLRKDIADFYARHKAGGDAAVRLNPFQAIDAKNAIDALVMAGVKMTLLDAVNGYLASLQPKEVAVPTKLASDAFDEFYENKLEGADKIQTMATTGKWVRSLGDRKLGDITAKDITDYLNENYAKRKPKTYNSHLSYIKTFLNWCCREPQEYIVKNPAGLLPPRPEPWEEPDYMKPEDVEQMFRILEQMREERPDMLAYAIVSFFCGCRAIEIQRMAEDPDAAKISIEGETIRIAKAKGYQQGKRPRAFHIEPTALAWMKSFDFLSAIKTVTKNTQKDIFDTVREKGVPVFHNCGRHTFITYHVAAYGDPFKTTAMVGTSEKMRADNYCGLAEKRDALKYFGILPKREG